MNEISSIKHSHKLYLVPIYSKLPDAALFSSLGILCRAIYVDFSFTASKITALSLNKLKKNQGKKEMFHYEEESNNDTLKGKWNTSYFTKIITHYFVSI